MRLVPLRSAAPAALALLAACASSPGGAPAPAPARDDGPFTACPGQEAAMAALAGRTATPVRTIPPVEITNVEIPVAREGDPAPGVWLELEARVDAAGRVESVRTRRGSGSPDVDGAFAKSLREARFDPATENAFPIPGCVIVKVRAPGA